MGFLMGQAQSPPTASVRSFSQLYKLYFSFVWSCARRLGVSEAETDDVVQEIFIVIHSRRDTLEHPESLRSWIYGITRRIVSTYPRAKRAKLAGAATFANEYDVQYPQQPSPQQLAEQSDQVRLLWSLLEKLDASKREIFVLAELDEMTVPEIASAIQVPLNTAYSRLRAARQELEEALVRHRARTAKRGPSRPT